MKDTNLIGWTEVIVFWPEDCPALWLPQYLQGRMVCFGAVSRPSPQDHSAIRQPAGHPLVGPEHFLGGGIVFFF